MVIASLWEIISQTSQSLVFFSIGLLGFLYLGFTAALGGFGHDMDSGGHDVGGGHDVHGGDSHGNETVISIFSPKVISIFLVCFGGIGFAASVSGASTFWSIISGLATGIALSFFALILLRAFYRQQSSSTVDTNQAIGRTGQVTISIPKDGVGEVGVTVAGTYMTYSARTQSGSPASVGQRVTVKTNVGGQLVVETA